MNYFNNRISKEITETEFSEMKALLSDLAGKLNFLIGLTKKERLSIPRISRANKLFVEDAVQITQKNKSIFPIFIDVDEIERDYRLYNQLGELLQEVGILGEKLRDTQALAGSEAYTASLSCYKFLQIAAQNGMPGTDTLVDVLSGRFAKQGNSKKTEETEKVEAGY